MVIEPIDWDHEELISRQHPAGAAHLEPSTFRAAEGSIITEASRAVVRAVQGMGEPLTLIFNDLRIPVGLVDAPIDVERKWARAQAQRERNLASGVPLAAPWLGEVRQMAAACMARLNEGDLTIGDHDGLYGAHQALLWVLGEHPDTPLAYNVPMAPDAIPEPGNLSPEQLDGLACARCNRPSLELGPMVPLPVYGESIFVCEDYCGAEVVG